MKNIPVLFLTILGCSHAYAFIPHTACLDKSAANELHGDVVSGTVRQIIQSTKWRSDNKEIKNWSYFYKNGYLARRIRHQQPQPDIITDFEWSQEQGVILKSSSSELPLSTEKGMRPSPRLTESESIIYENARPIKRVTNDLIGNKVSGLGYYVSRAKSDGGRTEVCLMYFGGSSNSDTLRYTEFDAKGRLTVSAYNFNFKPLHAEADPVIYSYLNDAATKGVTSVSTEYDVTQYTIETSKSGEELEKATTISYKNGYKNGTAVQWWNSKGWLVEERTNVDLRKGYTYVTDKRGNWITKETFYYGILPQTQKYGWEPSSSFEVRAITYEK